MSRPCFYKIRFQPNPGEAYRTEWRPGIFHGWFQEGSTETGIEAVGVIETTGGSVITVGAAWVNFSPETPDA